MATAGEHASKEADVAAFFALPRSRLYGGALLVLIVGVASLAGLRQLSETIGLWVAPLGTASIAFLIALLRRSATGRGAIWTFTSRWDAAPRVILIAWIIVTVVLSAGVAWLGLASS
jgi:hypothetical protein